MHTKNEFISTRLYIALANEGCDTSGMDEQETFQALRQFAMFTTEAEFLRTPNVGRKTLNELKEIAGMAHGEMGKAENPNKVIGVWDEIREDERGLFVKGRLLKDVALGREAMAEKEMIKTAKPISQSISFDGTSLVKDIERMVSKNLSIFIEREASKQVRDYVKATSYQLRGMVETEVRNIILSEIQKQNLDQHISEMVKSAVRKVSAS